MAKAKRGFVPVHTVVLDSLQKSVEARINSHRVKVGDGLETKEYERMVGRIKEGTVLLRDIEDLRQRLRNDDDLGDDE